MTEPEQQNEERGFREFFPNISDADRPDAQDRFDRYLALALTIFIRNQDGTAFLADLGTLTGTPEDSTMNTTKADSNKNVLDK